MKKAIKNSYEYIILKQNNLSKKKKKKNFLTINFSELANIFTDI